MPSISLPKKLIPPNMQVFVIPLGLLAALVIMTIFSIRFGFARISTQRQEVETANKNESVLLQKESVLKEVETEIPAHVKVLAAVMPEKNPSLAMISQLKLLSSSKGLVVENIKVSSSMAKEAGLSEVDVTFGVDGPMLQVIDFIASIKDLAPVSTLEKAKLNQSGEATRADLTVRVYYAAFPEKLPSLTEPVRGLTSSEKETLTNLSSLLLPAFIELAPQGPTQRDSPFD
jgi:Tfp pilus assembly protein PilO